MLFAVPLNTLTRGQRAESTEEQVSHNINIGISCRSLQKKEEVRAE